MKKIVATVHYNTPELTEAMILSLRKHGGEDYQVVVLDNSDKRPFKLNRKKEGCLCQPLGKVKVLNNRKGQIIDLARELDKFPNKDESYGCAIGCHFGSDRHMMSVQKLWELVPEGFILVDSDILIKGDIDFMFVEDQCCVGYVSSNTAKRIPRLVPMLLWINVPMCVAGGARFFDPDRAWALHTGWEDPRNFWDTGAAFLDDIRRLKPQCHGKAISRDTILSLMEHYGAGSWERNDLEKQWGWLNEHRDLWA